MRTLGLRHAGLPRERGVDLSRADGDHAEPVGVHLVGQRFGEPDHPELRRAVGSIVGHSNPAEQRGDVDDDARPAPQHAGQERARDEDRASQIHRDHALDGRGGEARERPRLEHAGVVHQAVHAPHAPGHPRYRARVADIDLDESRAVRAQRARHRPPERRPQLGDHHSPAVAGQRFGRGAPDAAARAGDERDARGHLDS